MAAHHRSMRAVRQNDWFTGPSRELVTANKRHVEDLSRVYERGHGELRLRDEEAEDRPTTNLARFLPRPPLP